MTGICSHLLRFIHNLGLSFFVKVCYNATSNGGTMPIHLISICVTGPFGAAAMEVTSMAKNPKRRKKVQRQNWTPNFLARILYRVWKLGLSALKIAGAALATVLIIGIVCGFVFVNFLGEYLQEDVMTKAEMNLDDYDLDKTSYIYCLDSNGDIQILQQIYSTTDRRWASYEELPEDLINACIAIEDKRFYEHQGVDWVTTVKACLSMFFGGDQFGGSTITQQLIKNLKLGEDASADDVTVQRKVMEIFRAQAFEKKYDKKVVLEWYMNTVFFGEGCYGVKSAADNYFGKELQDMTTAELASLIGITNNPALYRPYRETLDKGGLNGAERNRVRQVNILDQMLEQGWIDQAKYDTAIAQEMVFKRGIAPEDRWVTCEDTFDVQGGVATKGCGLNCAVRDLVVQGTGESAVYYCPNCQQKVDITTDASQSIYSYYVDQVLDDVAMALARRDGVTEWDKEIRNNYLDLIGRAGYHIYTPFNPEVQKAVDKIYTDLSQLPQVQSGQQLQSAIVITDNRTGDIVAMAGGVGEKQDFDAYNRATDARLQVGSSIKPLTVYAPAFELGLITPASVIDDLPLYVENDKPYPNNVSKRYNFSSTIIDGIAHSYNTVSVNTLDMIGTRYSFNFARDKFGLSTLVESLQTSSGNVLTDIAYSPLAMGGLTRGATVRDMTCAYGTFTNNGVYREGRVFTKVYDDTGKLVLDNTQEQRTILSEKAVNYINYCLDSAVAYGTGDDADLYKELGIDVAGKTGSTNDYKDRFFCGYTGYYTAAVWCGFDIPEEIVLVGSYVNPAADLWKKVMVQLHQGKETIPLYDTTDMVQISVCLESGKLATEACRNDIRADSLNRVKSKIWVYPEDAPTQLCDKHISVDYCDEGHGVANEWCHKFADVGAIRLVNKSLVKMTQSKIDDLLAVEKHGLTYIYLHDEYVYLVDSYGKDQPFYGMHGDINSGLNIPYVGCQTHTYAAWQKYKEEHPWIEGGGSQIPDATDPTDPTGPENTMPGATMPGPSGADNQE